MIVVVMIIGDAELLLLFACVTSDYGLRCKLSLIKIERIPTAMKSSESALDRLTGALWAPGLQLAALPRLAATAVRHHARFCFLPVRHGASACVAVPNMFRHFVCELLLGIDVPNQTQVWKQLLNHLLMSTAFILILPRFGTNVEPSKFVSH